MTTPYRISQAANYVYRTGVSYHAYGTVKQGKVAMFDFFQCDSVTDAQVASLREWCPEMQVRGVRHKHAPEMTCVHLLFPKAAYFHSIKAV